MDKFGNLKQMKQLSYIVNTVVLICECTMLAMFCAYQVRLMVYVCIPITAVYLINYVMIAKGKLAGYVWTTYFLLIVYMFLATISLGNSYGFMLYSMSIIPIIFFTEYLAFKLQSKSPKAMLISAMIAFVYFVGTLYPMIEGPIYRINSIIEAGFFIGNSACVFCFLIFYTNYLVKIIVNTQSELTRMATRDKLTDLYNRHFMISHLEERLKDVEEKLFVALLDIDDFKKINDKYGHNCGDEALIRISESMKTVCNGSLIARWGGEEFLIVGGKMENLEKLRSKIENSDFVYQGNIIPMTVTIGVAEYQEGQGVDEWVRRADEKLYEGKENGKNVVVY